MNTGPDDPAIQCRPPDGCCAGDPSDISLFDWTCQLRALLPEGEFWNTSLPTEAPETATIEAATVGCMRVGCEQLVLGSCCDEPTIPCDEDRVAPQLAIVDVFAAVTYRAVQALGGALKELDPCTAELTVQRWGARFGLVGDDACAPQWSGHVISALICAMMEIRRNVINLATLQGLAGRFGAEITVHEAGDFNCGPVGWWTMARDRDPDCPRPMETCPPGARPFPDAPMGERRDCDPLPPSINIVTQPSEIRLRDDCNLSEERVCDHPFGIGQFGAGPFGCRPKATCDYPFNAGGFGVGPFSCEPRCDSPFGIGQFGAGPFGCGEPSTGRPYSVGAFGVGPFGRWPRPTTRPHDPELYDAFKWLLPRILPKPGYYCVYERNESECIT